MEQVNRGYNDATQAPQEESFEYVPVSNNTDSDEQPPITILPVINKKSPNYSIRRRSRVAPNRSRAASNNVNRSNNTTTRNTASNNVTRSNNTVNRTNVVSRSNNTTTRSNNVTRPNTSRPNTVNRGTSIVRRNNATSRQVQNTKSSYVTRPKNNNTYTTLKWRDNVNTILKQVKSRNTAPANNKGFSGLMNRLNQRFGTRPEDTARQIAIVNDYRRKPHKISFWR